jgi:hypothetical protein
MILSDSTSKIVHTLGELNGLPNDRKGIQEDSA